MYSARIEAFLRTVINISVVMSSELFVLRFCSESKTCITVYSSLQSTDEVFIL